MNTIEIGFSKTEVLSTTAATVPILGTVPVVVKVALGAIQIAVASMFFVTNLVPAALTRNVSWLERPKGHVKHGVANIISGIFESIPLFGTCLFFARRTSFGGNVHAVVEPFREIPVYHAFWRVSCKFEYASIVKKFSLSPPFSPSDVLRVFAE